MNGAESLLATMTGAGVDACFANPGTSECISSRRWTARRA